MQVRETGQLGNHFDHQSLYDTVAPSAYALALAVLHDEDRACEVVLRAFRASRGAHETGRARQVRVLREVRAGSRALVGCDPEPGRLACDLARRGGYHRTEIAAILGTSPDDVAELIRRELVRVARTA